jgi:hypothetical protein
MVPSRALLALLSLPFLGCGTDAPARAPETPTEPASTASAAPQATAPKKSLADHRRGFMDGCAAKTPGAPDFCECGWDQLQKFFTAEEMDQAPDPKRMQEFKGRVEAACKGKLPEDKIKEGFLEGCMSGQPKLQPYCECTWTAYRKRLSPAELSDEAITKTERFSAARSEGVKTCSAKLPEQVARDAFLTGCAADAALNGFCACAWKQLRTEKSPAEISAGLVDMDAARPKIEKTCGKLRPAR